MAGDRREPTVRDSQRRLGLTFKRIKRVRASRDHQRRDREILQPSAKRLAAQSPTALRLGLRAFYTYAEVPLAESVPKLRDELAAILGTADGVARAVIEREITADAGRAALSTAIAALVSPR